MIHVGDCREVLPTLPANSVNCCVTSPPYFGLRSYLRADHPDKAKEIGSEQLHDCAGWATGKPCGDCFVCVQVDVFRHVRRVLRADGVCWINLGDSYCSGTGGDRKPTTLAGHGVPAGWTNRNQPKRTKRMPGIKTKDLMGMPWRVALALQADGWWWRDVVVWRKPDPMPSSANDRCTPAWEPVLMLTKSERYFFDWRAIATEVAPSTRSRLQQDVDRQAGSTRANDGGKTNGTMKAVSSRNSFARSTKATDGAFGQTPQHRPEREQVAYDSIARRRNVWDIPTQGYSEAHFATFPERLPELCILATCPAGGTVLDPFHGSGTTGQVAQRLGLDWIGIDLNDEYKPLQEARALREQPGLPLGPAVALA